MGRPEATIVVVPRERFSVAERSLRRILETTPPETPVVYVDAGSPPEVSRAIEGLRVARDLVILRVDGFLSPNEARNLGLRAARGRYVAFVDNDVFVTPGWLDRLLYCAEETGADVVGPLYLHGPAADACVHMAGGEARLEERAGRRVLHERHRFAGRPLAEVGARLRREPCELVEFHCMLVRRSLFDRIGALDEELLSCHEHIDLCLLVRETGGSVWFEPASVVAYVPPPPFGPGDRSYFLLRWSRAWNWRSLRRFARKWRLDDDDDDLRRQLAWPESHRKLALGSLVGRAGRRLGGGGEGWIVNGCDRLVELLVTRRQQRRYDGRRSGAGQDRVEPPGRLQ